ncbi:MAG: hypothetical protein ABSA97_14125 [Verrucomicrobiia bacterium]|jgi:hypothetical protein
MKLSREFKENVTAWGFFILSILVAVIAVVVIFHPRTSHRSAPATEQFQQ